jgi:hypothetical protein
MGFTPGDPSFIGPYLNPKYAKIFRMAGGGSEGQNEPFVQLGGRNIIQGFKRLGYRAYGSGAVAWFNPVRPTSRILIDDFDDFFFPGNTYSLDQQLEYLERVTAKETGPVFVFLNVGETHVPYFYRGAPWDRLPSPCIPFGNSNDAAECSRRQRACLEYVDAMLGPLLDRFAAANVLVCADHGDAWGENGLWEHGIHDPKVLEVPLFFRLGERPTPSLARRLPLITETLRQDLLVKAKKMVSRFRASRSSRSSSR